MMLMHRIFYDLIVGVFSVIILDILIEGICAVVIIVNVFEICS